MSKTIVYTAVVVVCLGVGALIAGLAVHFTQVCYPDLHSRSADCLLVAHNLGNSIRGRMQITQTSSTDVSIVGNITGLSTGLHGFHVHQYGVQGVDCVSAGGHWNPHNMDHGRPSDKERHAGDLGNLNITSVGEFNVSVTDTQATLFGEDSMIGRALVIHEDSDDFSQPTGNAGSRLACCTIMHLKEEE